MVLVFDTSALSQIIDRDLALIKVASRGEYTSLVLPLATDAELRYGFKHGNREASNLLLYENIKRDYGVQLAAPDQETALHHAELATWCRKHGKNLSNNDLWIAATAVQHGGQLLTTDNDFAALPQVRLANLSAI